jgi:lauroyl/myristoyl acyltransferase
MKDRLGPAGLQVIRRLERRLSPDRLFSVLLPLAVARVAMTRIERLPGYFRKSTSPRAQRRAQVNYLLSRMIEFFPDRLTTPKWQGRFQTNGLDYLKEARNKRRPVILVFLHFGTYKLIPFWLRALGIPVVALLGGKSENRSRVKRLKDQFSPFPQIPTVVYQTDQLRKAIELLSAGYVLFVAADMEAAKQINVRLEDYWSFRMATGALRLASHCDAELIPCWMMDEGRWHFRLEIGRPVSVGSMNNGSDPALIGQKLLQEILADARNHPEQCADYLTDCFRPSIPIPIAELT